MKKIIFFFFISFLFCQCSKDEEEFEPAQDLVYQSLIAERDTLAPGEDTKIKATATGSNLSYFWSATKGDILGSGSEVTYASSPCHIGKNQITCEITNGNNQSNSKTVDIVVLEE